MRFTIDKDQFLKGLLIAGHSIGNKNPNPMYLCFKLELTSRGLEITGSNGDITIWTLVPNVLNDKEIIRNSSLGATLVNAHVITEVVRKLEGTEVSMEIIDNPKRSKSHVQIGFARHAQPALEHFVPGRRRHRQPAGTRRQAGHMGRYCQRR